MREPLLLPLIAVACGIYLGEAFAFTRWEAVLPLIALALLALPRTRCRFAAALLSLTFTGAWLAAVHRPTREPFLNIEPREIVTAEGCVVEPSILAGDLVQFTLELEPGARVRVQVPEENAIHLTYGQRVEITARIRTPHNFGNPGAFDYTAYLARRDVYWTALVPARGEIHVLPGVCGSRFMAGIFSLRMAALNRMERLYPNDRYSSAMLQAVLIGESANLERLWTEDFRRSGTYHALVISGIHVSILAGILLYLLRVLQAPLLPSLAITALAAWTYALVSGFSTPVVRAAGGFTLYLIGSAMYRRARVLNLLSAVALVYLAFDPGQLFEASFHLSFLSVAAIGALAQPALERSPYAFAARDLENTDHDPHIDPRAAQLRVELRLVAETIALWTCLPQVWATRAISWITRAAFFAWELAVVSVAIQIALAVAMAAYFHRVSFTGITANLAIVPLTNLLVPVGFLALFTGWQWMASLAGLLLKWSASIAAWHANLEPSWRVPAPPLWLAIAFVIALIAIAWSIRHTHLRWPLAASVAALLALIVWSPWPAHVTPGQLELTAIDVGQGDSLLAVFPDGTTMLVDTGGRLTFGEQRRKPNLDMGEDVVSPYLWSRGIKHLDILALTHNHQDHTGGVAAIIENFQPREIWVGANIPDSLFSTTSWVRLVVQKFGAPRTIGGATVQVLAPLPDHTSTSTTNNDSLVLRLDYRSRSFLLTGDLERAVENRLLATAAPLDVDVLKVGHHGSRTSTTQPFLDAVSPDLALISSGFENSFGHPHPDVLARLQSREATILRTDVNGLVSIRTDGYRIFYDTAQWSAIRRRGLPVHLLN